MVTFLFLLAMAMGIVTFVGGVAICIKFVKDKKPSLGIILLVIFTIIASMLMVLAVSVGYLSQM